VVLALFGAVAGQAVVWYTGQFYVLFFLTTTLQLDQLLVYKLLGAALLIGTPGFLLFGWLSDRIGRVKIILAGCLIAAIVYFPLFKAITHFANPQLESFRDRTVITVSANDCNTHIFTMPWTVYSACDRVRDSLTKRGLSFESQPGVEGQPVVTHIVSTVPATGAKEDKELKSWTPDKKPTDTDTKYIKALGDELKTLGYPGAPKNEDINFPMLLLTLVVLIVLVTMVYGPIAALLVELFPARIRYTSMSLPYHIANGWLGGLLPLVAIGMSAAWGNIYFGLWYPIIVAAITVVVGGLFLRDAKPGFNIQD
jgi:MFS family permease